MQDLKQLPYNKDKNVTLPLSQVTKSQGYQDFGDLGLFCWSQSCIDRTHFRATEKGYKTADRDACGEGHQDLTLCFV